MAEPNDYITATRKNFVSNDNEGRMVEKCIIEIQGTFLVKIHDYAFNGNIGENAFKHIDKFLEVVGPIKINGLPQDRFRLSVFPVSLAGAARMVRVGSMTYFQDHRWYDELADGKLKDETLTLKAKIEGSWGDTTPRVNAHEIARFTRMENFRRGPYANMKTEWTGNTYLDVNRIFRRDYEASNVGNAHENQGHEEQKSNPNPKPSNCKIRRFEMMKYSFDDDEVYITIKKSKYLNHSKDSLDAYRELLHLIDERWAVTTPDE
ncbi:hypothetical protein Tco_0276293 [Tanacetum coccineum]